MSHVNFMCVCGGDIDTTLEKQQQRKEYAKPILNGRIIQLLWETQEYLLTVRQTSCLLREYQWSLCISRSLSPPLLVVILFRNNFLLFRKIFYAFIGFLKHSYNIF